MIQYPTRFDGNGLESANGMFVKYSDWERERFNNNSLVQSCRRVAEERFAKMSVDEFLAWRESRGTFDTSGTPWLQVCLSQCHPNVLTPYLPHCRQFIAACSMRRVPVEMGRNPRDFPPRA